MDTELVAEEGMGIDVELVLEEGVGTKFVLEGVGIQLVEGEGVGIQSPQG